MNAKDQTLLINKFWKDSRVMVTDEFTAPPVILQVDNSIIATLSNFSASTGKAKSKKTFNNCAITAAMLINGKVLNYTASLPKEKRKILYVDTEQSPFHCKRVLVRILTLANLPLDRQPENLEFLALRRYAPNERALIIDEAIKNTENLGFVVIDGIRDLVFDINSPSESTDIITRLMQWTEQNNIHIHTVLHLNKGDDNTRGHLGTELNNKAEAILQVTKSDFDNDVSFVSAKCIRDVEFEPFAFRINDSGIPELSADVVSGKISKNFSYDELSEEQHRKALSMVFPDNKPLGYQELIDLLQEHYQTVSDVEFGTNKTKQLKKFLVNKEMIIQQGKKYVFNPEFYD